MKTLFIILAACASCATIEPKISQVHCEYWTRNCSCVHGTVYARYSYMIYKKQFDVVPDSMLVIGKKIKPYGDGWKRIR